MNDILERIGKFYVEWRLIESGKLHLILAKLEFVPYRVECLYSSKRFLYEGLSSLFERKSRLEESPIYEITVLDFGANVFSVKVKIA